MLLVQPLVCNAQAGLQANTCIYSLKHCLDSFQNLCSVAEGASVDPCNTQTWAIAQWCDKTSPEVPIATSEIYKLESALTIETNTFCFPQQTKRVERRVWIGGTVQYCSKGDFFCFSRWRKDDQMLVLEVEPKRRVF